MSQGWTTNIGGKMLEPRATPARAVLFGGFQLFAPDGTPVTLANRRARALLGILCLEPDHTVARTTLTRLLWPGRFEPQARASLRQCLLELRRIVEGSGCIILHVTRDRVDLLPGTLQTDLGELAQVLATGDLGQINASLQHIGTQSLLDEVYLGDAFTAWLGERRAMIEHRLGSGIAETVDRLHRVGNTAAAARLREAWGIRKLVALPDRAAAGGIDRARIAVLPFSNAGTGSGDEYFADGFADELISALGNVPQLLVMGRTSSFHFRDSALLRCPP